MSQTASGTSTSGSSSRIGEILMRSKLIDAQQLQAALERQRRQGGGRIGEHLVALGFLTEEALTQQLAKQFAIPIIDPAGQEVPPQVLALLPAPLIRKHLMLPLRLTGSTLTVLMADPSDHFAINEVKFLTGYDVRVTVAPAFAIQRALDRLFDTASVCSEALSKASNTPLEVVKEEEPVDVQEVESQSEDGPVIALVNAIFAEAIKRRASDIHIEPYEKFVRVRFRIDGVLQEIMKPPSQLKNAIVSRIKIMANLDIAERRLAHDGRIRLQVGPSRQIDVRVSIVPTHSGEKVVLRILDKSTIELDLGRLGFQGGDLEAFRAACARPHGIVLVTGPTGSGKTTTLYAILSELNQTAVNISTAEDPIEYHLPGVNQIQIQETIGRDFAYCLRALLRQDPDVIMVGEIRDSETAEMAIKAALTGHLVLSTLHTNDAPSSVTRLLNMGVEPHHLASALSMVVAQRLLRRLCRRCRVKTTVDPEQLVKLGVPPNEVGTFQVYSAGGCDDCAGTGYLGRFAIYEMLEVTDDIRYRMLRADDGGASLKKAAVEAGMRTLRVAALEHLRDGTTSIEEITRLTVTDETRTARKPSPRRAAAGAPKSPRRPRRKPLPQIVVEDVAGLAAVGPVEGMQLS